MSQTHERDEGGASELHVLIVDDDPDFGRAVARLLEDSGLTPTWVSTPEDGLRILTGNARSPDCILLDLSMPKYSGNDVLSMTREGGLDVPVVMMSGLGDIRSAVRAMKLGAYDFLEKPFDERVLLSTIARAVSGGRDKKPSPTRDRAISSHSSITSREQQILELTVDGYTAKEIGRRLSLSHRTVENYRARLMDKFGAKRLTELVRLAQSDMRI